MTYPSPPAFGPAFPGAAPAPSEPFKLLVMGVSGCGKSSTAVSLARVLGALMIEGDEHHLPASQEKMRQGIALGDADHEPWLDRLGALAQEAEGHVVLTCSALKRSYRERLRAAVPTLRIVYLEIGVREAQKRVAARPGHWFPASLVNDQFATLESPVGESGVLRVNAMQATSEQCRAILHWLEPMYSRRTLC